MRRSRLALLALVALAAVDQAVLHTALADGRFLGQIVAPFDPPVFIEPQLRHLADARRIVAGDDELRAQSIFDQELGWCPRPSSNGFGARFDALGARASTKPHARAKPAGVRRVLTFGGSFTMGMEVGDTEAWPARVEAGLGDVEVVNLGVAGYGLDQGLLRFRRDGPGLAPDAVWFGLMPQASLRVSTHYAPAYYRWATMAAFKPRFLPAGGPDDTGLRLIANPVNGHEDYVRLLSDQEAFLDAIGATDLWVRRAPAAFAPRGSSPLHWSAATRLALTLHEARGRDRAAWLQDPESEIYVVMRNLLLAFATEARAAGATFRIVVLPSRADLVLRAEAGAGFWERLLADLGERGVESFDCSPALVEAGALTDDGLWMPGSHYSARGNDVVAAALIAAGLPR
ncbi:MAG: hypothetical protein AAF682_16240 [Planctomycetota bacterium]